MNDVNPAVANAFDKPAENGIMVEACNVDKFGIL